MLSSPSARGWSEEVLPSALSEETRVFGSGGAAGGPRLRLHTVAADGETLVLECDNVVNAAGHGAPPIAHALEGAPEKHYEVVPRRSTTPRAPTLG